MIIFTKDFELMTLLKEMQLDHQPTTHQFPCIYCEFGIRHGEPNSFHHIEYSSERPKAVYIMWSISIDFTVYSRIKINKDTPKSRRQ